MEPVDPVAGSRLQPSRHRDPGHQSDHGAGHGGNGPDRGPIGQQDQPKMLLGRADRGQHAELAQAALGDDHEAGRGDQGNQQQHDRGRGEHARGGRRPLALGRGRAQHRPVTGRARLEPATGARREGRGLVGAGPHQDRHRRRRVGVPRRDQGELVVQIPWVLDQADHRPGPPVKGQGAADPGLEGRRHRVGDRDLAGGGRPAARPQRQHRAAVGAVGVLGT
jgi:hypothetical protein